MKENSLTIQSRFAKYFSALIVCNVIFLLFWTNQPQRTCNSSDQSPPRSPTIQQPPQENSNLLSRNQDPIPLGDIQKEKERWFHEIIDNYFIFHKRALDFQNMELPVHERYQQQSPGSTLASSFYIINLFWAASPPSTPINWIGYPYVLFLYGYNRKYVVSNAVNGMGNVLQIVIPTILYAIIAQVRSKSIVFQTTFIFL